MSVSSLFLKLDNYEKALPFRLLANMSIDTAIHLNNKDAKETHEYYKALFLTLLEILRKFNDIEELEKIKKVIKT